MLFDNVINQRISQTRKCFTRKLRKKNNDNLLHD